MCRHDGVTSLFVSSWWFRRHCACRHTGVTGGQQGRADRDAAAESVPAAEDDAGDQQQQQQPHGQGRHAKAADAACYSRLVPVNSDCLEIRNTVPCFDQNQSTVTAWKSEIQCLVLTGTSPQCRLF